MKNEILPIGSIVRISGQDVMICAYVNKGAIINGETYDYAGCLYPIGMTKDAVMIKKEKIEKVVFIGFQDQRFAELKHSFRLV